MTSTEAVGAGREHHELESLRRVGDTRWQGRSTSGEELIVDRFGAADAELPTALGRAVLMRDASGTWQLRSERDRRSWLFAARGARVFVHRPVAAQLRAAIAPRAMPLARRLLWRAIPALLSNRLGRRLLGRLRPEAPPP